MKKLLNTIKVSLIALGMVAVGGFAVAGLWNTTFPIVGGASYCGSSVNAACVSTIPAGPASVTGNETIPADTNLAGGAATPQTVVMSMRALNAAPISYNLCAAAACGSFTVGDNSGGVLLSYSTTIDSATIVTPASPMDGQIITVAADHTITTLTLTANTGQTFSVTAPVVLTASATVPQGYKFMYVLSTTKWYRVQ